MVEDLRKAQAIGALLKKNAGLIALGVLLTLLYTVAVFLTPIVSQRLVDDVLAAVDIDRVYAGILFFVIVCTLQPVFSFFKELAFVHAAQRLLFDLRSQVFAKMLRLRYSLIESGNSGDFISRITNDVGAVSYFFTDVIAAVLNDVALIALITIGMLMQSVLITLVIAAFFLAFFIVNSIVSRKFEALSKQSLENYDELLGSLTESWRNIVLIKTYRLIDGTLRSFQRVIGETKGIGIRFGRWSALLSGASGLIMVLSLAGIYSIGTLFIFAGTMSVGSVIALGLYFQLLATPVMELSAVVVRYRETRPSVERIGEYLDQEEEDGDKSQESGDVRELTAGTAGQPVIDVVGVSYAYTDDTGVSKPVFDDATLRLGSPGLYVLSGSSGSGKSTLLKLLLRLYDPQAGSILLDGVSPSAAELRRLCAYVPQEPGMLAGSLAYNLLLDEGSDTARYQAMSDLADELMLGGLIESLPEGFATQLTETAGFSGGEARRLALIRAVLADSPVLLLDEVTAGLDAASADRLISLLLRLSSQKTVLVASHDQRLLDRADAAYLIQKGSIVRLFDNTGAGHQ